MTDRYTIHLQGGGKPITIDENLRITSGVGIDTIGGRLIGFVDPEGKRERVGAAAVLADPERFDEVVDLEPSIGSRAQIFGWGYLVDHIELHVEPSDG